MLPFKCRTNNLNLIDRNRFKGQETKCDLFDNDKKDLISFVLWCPAFIEERQKYRWLRQPYEEDKTDITGKYRFDNELVKETKKIICKFRNIRANKRANNP